MTRKKTATTKEEAEGQLDAPVETAVMQRRGADEWLDVRIPLFVQWMKRDITKGQDDPRRVVTAFEMRATAGGAIDLDVLFRHLENCGMMACLIIVPPGEMRSVMTRGRRS